MLNSFTSQGNEISFSPQIQISQRQFYSHLCTSNNGFDKNELNESSRVTLSFGLKSGVLRLRANKASRLARFVNLGFLPAAESEIPNRISD